MWRKVVFEIKYHHLVSLFVLLSLIFSTAGIFVWWYRPYAGLRTPAFLILLILLVAVLHWAILLVLATHIAHRDGFLDGYGKGLEKSFKDWVKKAQDRFD